MQTLTRHHVLIWVCTVSQCSKCYSPRGGRVWRWCTLSHRGVQLILAYIWARLAILVAAKGEGIVFISSVSSLSFLFLFLPCSCFSSPLLSLLSLFSLSLGDDTKWPTRVDVLLNPNTIQKKKMLQSRFYR